MLSALTSRLHSRKVFREFADSTGLVYFGDVNAHSDDHHVIRGLTLSPRHIDHHYSIGSHNGYDVALTSRRLTFGQTQSIQSEWLVLDINLKHSSGLPHVFIGANQHNEHFYAQLFMTFRHLHKAQLGTFEAYTPLFSERYSLYGAPTQHIELERVFTNQITHAIGEHFLPFSIEIVEGHLYVYAEDQHINVKLLQKMLRDGLWLSEYLDHTLAK